MENYICKQHSGHEERLKKLEDNVKDLWNKWDFMQRLTLGIFITMVLNLVGVIFTLIKI